MHYYLRPHCIKGAESEKRYELEIIFKPLIITDSFEFINAIVLKDDELLVVNGGADVSYCGVGCGLGCGGGCGKDCYGCIEPEEPPSA